MQCRPNSFEWKKNLLIPSTKLDQKKLNLFPVSLRDLAYMKMRPLDNVLSITSISWISTSQSAFTSSKLTIETLEQGVKYVQS